MASACHRRSPGRARERSSNRKKVRNSYQRRSPCLCYRQARHWHAYRTHTTFISKSKLCRCNLSEAFDLSRGLLLVIIKRPANKCLQAFSKPGAKHNPQVMSGGCYPAEETLEQLLRHNRYQNDLTCPRRRIDRGRHPRDLLNMQKADCGAAWCWVTKSTKTLSEKGETPRIIRAECVHT